MGSSASVERCSRHVGFTSDSGRIAATLGISVELSLGRDARKPLNLHDRWRVPLAGQCIRLRAVETHGQVEAALWSRQPICLLVLSGALVLQIEIERTGIVLERHPRTDRKAVDAVRHLEAVRVIEGHRPERIHRRRRSFLEM